MKNDGFQVLVKLWGIPVGTLRWDRAAGRATFAYSEEYLDSPFDISPTLYPKDAKRRQLFYGSKVTEGLPEFLADSLPDDWGNILYDKWTSRHAIPTDSFRSLSKLSFIGKRAMGALEFEPVLDDDADTGEAVAVDELYQQALLVLTDRLDACLPSADDLSLAQLIRFGTSVGGKHAKGLVALSPDGQIRSGQTEQPPEFRYYILKFKEDNDIPTSEIEKIFYDMATDCGIDMMPSSLFPAGGVSHFLTERFDRLPGGAKLHTQTLRALAPSANDYTNLFWLCEKLKVPSGRKDMLFRQMVFNHFAGVSDDHSKNFTFVMDREGRWNLSPAYDLMFTANTWLDAAACSHCLGVGGKFSHLTKEDFVDYGEDFGIENCPRTIDQVAEVVSSFPERCRQYGIEGSWTDRIWNAIRGFLPAPKPILQKQGNEIDANKAIKDKFAGKEVVFLDSVPLMTEGEVSGTMVHFTVDGKKRTCVTDLATGSICISPGHIRADELDMGSWKTLDGKSAAWTGTRVISLKDKREN